MDDRAEIARKAKLHGGWVERTILGLLDDIERLEDMTARRIDANQAEIVQALRQVGASVQILSAVGRGCPDLVAGYQGRNVLLEVKDSRKPPSARVLTPDERDWHFLWRGQVAVVTCVSEALRAVGAVYED